MVEMGTAANFENCNLDEIEFDAEGEAVIDDEDSDDESNSGTKNNPVV